MGSLMASEDLNTLSVGVPSITAAGDTCVVTGGQEENWEG